MDSINGLNEMNMDDLAMDEYLRSLDEKRDDEYRCIFNAHLRLMFLQSRTECTGLPTKNETAKTNENSWNMTIPSLNLNKVLGLLAKKETRLQLQGIMNLKDQIKFNTVVLESRPLWRTLVNYMNSLEYIQSVPYHIGLSPIFINVKIRI